MLPKPILNIEKKKMTVKVVEFCAIDIRPFEIITGKGFIRLAQHLVSIGARHGEIDVTTILPHPTTVSRNVHKMKNKKHEEIFPVLQKAIDNNECAATSDGWTDKYKNNNYLSMTVHFFDDDFRFQKKVLFTSLFDEKKKTGLKIRNKILTKFGSLGFQQGDLGKIPMVTDRGGNMVKAFKGRRYNRKNCIAHVLNRVLANTFEKHAPVQVEILIDNCKSIVRHFKQSTKANALKYTLKQETKTRWNSRLAMIVSVTTQYSQIMSLLTERQRKEWCFNVDIANEIIRFLKIFKEATDQLEGDNYPTYNYILLWRCEIYKHLTETIFVGPVKTIAKFALQYLEEKFPVSMEYKVACFLDPRYCLLKMLTESERKDVFDEISDLMDEIRDPVPVESGPPAKKPKYTLYEEIVDNRNEREIQLYIQTSTYSKVEKSKLIVQKFWNDNQIEFPKLYLLARKRLCVPATSAPSERTFSSCGRTIDFRRTNIKPKILDDLLYLRDSYFKEEE